jgi:hypothetical protein
LGTRLWMREGLVEVNDIRIVQNFVNF